ncbi:MAG: glutamine-hydrolyzing GMP synthase, partial [Bacteroidetes bacterium]|nr:glutamine-hydrolyzing GMP synthase [Bacteroidota bacterium]
MQEQILILDFGSQYTQLIARRLRELNVYCEIHPFNHLPLIVENTKGIILSGSPASVRDEQAPQIDLDLFIGKLPVLAICYGAQYIAQQKGGNVAASNHREYGRAMLNKISECKLLKGLNFPTQVWMSHGDTVTNLPTNVELIANTESIANAAYKLNDSETYCIQFHPEVTHSTEGSILIKNFITDICGCKQDWNPENFIHETVGNLKTQLGNDKVILGLSGGVDSSVAAGLLHKAIGKNLHCIFIDNGLLRLNEYEQVLESYKQMDLNVVGINSTHQFYEALANENDPERKRKAIGRVFVEVFEQESKKIEGAKWLAQGTIYPDVIESVSVKGPSATIKSHHNVGGLPEKMDLKIVEPLRSLFKDEVRRVGAALNIPSNILGRHPFPGPGLAIRIIGDITPEKVNILQQADAIFIDTIKEKGWYDKIWQAGAIFLPVQSVGVMGDERTYENVICLRAVTSLDGMTADWVHIPYEILAEISNKKFNRVKGINREVYDISS